MFTSLLLVFPLFLLYQVAVPLVPSSYNGADLITAMLLGLLHGRLGTYVVVNLALGAAYVILLAALGRRNRFDTKMFWPVVLESALYAVSMGSLIVFVMVDLLHIDPRLAVSPAGPTSPTDLGLGTRIVLSIGAGVHEELLFRLGMIPALALVCERVLGCRRWVSLAVAFVVSSVLFSAAHHVVGGEPWRAGVFVYRFLCGIFFASLFQFRGFAVAVYTHALYDIYVLVLRGG